MLLNPPFQCDLARIQVVSSINGLVCLSFYNNPTLTVLWNPATRKHWHIPNPQLLLASHEHESLGFAYDEKTDSYKVIRILYTTILNQPPLWEPMHGTRVEIYNTGTNTWRTKEVVDFLWLFYPISCGTVVSGSSFWFVIECQMPGSDCRDLIIMFDPSVEAFGFYPFPLGDLSSQRLRLGLGAIGEHCVLFSYWFRRKKDATVKLIDIWKFNKCDDGGSDPIYGEKLTMEFDCRPGLTSALGFTANGKIITLNESGTLVICDTHSAEYEIISHRDTVWGRCPKVYDYTESLVSPYSRVA